MTYCKATLRLLLQTLESIHTCVCTGLRLTRNSLAGRATPQKFQKLLNFSEITSVSVLPELKL